MKVRAIYGCNWLPSDVDGMTIYPFVFVRAEKKNASEQLLAHEMIHFRQVEADGWLRFYFRYLMQYFTGLRKLGHEQAYLNIDYERHARIWSVYGLLKQDRIDLGLEGK